MSSGSVPAVATTRPKSRLGREALGELETSPSKPSPSEQLRGQHISYKALNSATRSTLKRYDANGDGRVDASELNEVVHALVQAKFTSRLFLLSCLLVIVTLVLLLGCGFGLTWAVVLAHKETEVRGNTLYVRDTDTPAQLSSADFAPGRASVLTARSGGLVTTTELSQELPLTADLTADQLRSLHRVHLSGSNGARVGLRVRGVTLVTQQQALHIATYSGTLVVKGGQLSADSVPAGLVASAGVQWQAVTGVFNS